ncbi:uncharacterized protein F5Z01DRAFT_436643 [Emericellopsis atlantica]|uniref:CFEM domain-containing protein n=1 Tax=Emericellopsis atlantica TaxID=2614577 RepID=A0A9P7ZEA1_9HYPO|nr:uncharacterized protein F5Z01DRAFT_436643 [Emericellopsis atlantica]KAG9249873.1 hypothetical protein F5Z01DRAFT_436643 [Emericellopsis atlantica]
MKTSAVACLVAAGLAAGQGLQDVPKCAAPCIEQATTGNQIGGCGQFDIECICSNDDFLQNIACCLEDKCDASGKAAAVKFAQQICSTVSVDVPNQVECKASSSGGSGSTTTESKTGTATETATETTTDTATDSPSATPSSEQSKTSSAANSQETGGDGNAATGLSNVGGLIGAVVAMGFAL